MHNCDTLYWSGAMSNCPESEKNRESIKSECHREVTWSWTSKDKQDLPALKWGKTFLSEGTASPEHKKAEMAQCIWELETV